MEMTPEEAFRFQMQGIETEELNRLFFQRKSQEYYMQIGIEHDHKKDIRLQDESYYFYKDVTVDGKVITLALTRMAFTVGLMYNVTGEGTNTCYEYRYCYQTLHEAFEALMQWNGSDLAPGDWLKRKGEGGDLRNPKFPDPYE